MSQLPDPAMQNPNNAAEPVPEAPSVQPPPVPETGSRDWAAPLTGPDKSERFTMEASISELRAQFADVQTRIANLEGAVEAATRQIAFIPPQVRMLGSKVEGVATAITEPRLRAILLNLLGVYDLVDQLLRTLPAGSECDPAADHRRNYQVLRTQLRQVLEANGLSEIPTDGAFDPELHRATQTVACVDPAASGRILSVVRPGFRTDQAVLRYAEVVVSSCAPAEQNK